MSKDQRQSIGFYGLQQLAQSKGRRRIAVAKRAAREFEKNYEDMRLIVAHLGGGISVGVHREGKVVDVNNTLDGEGPFSPERSGGAPAGDLAKICFSGKYTHEEIKRMLKGEGGLQGYLGINDGREISKRIQNGDTYAEQIYRGMAYQISKEIGSCYAVLKGEVDALILTGGLAYDEQLIGWIKEYVKFIQKIVVYPGEDEMWALAEGTQRVLNGEEKAKLYKKLV